MPWRVSYLHLVAEISATMYQRRKQVAFTIGAAMRCLTWRYGVLLAGLLPAEGRACTGCVKLTVGTVEAALRSKDSML